LIDKLYNADRARTDAMLQLAALQQKQQQDALVHSLLQQISSPAMNASTSSHHQAAEVEELLRKKRRQAVLTLHALGNRLRSREDPFIDCLELEDPNDPDQRRARGGVSQQFPERIHNMLLEIEKDGKDDIVSFLPHGRAFSVHKVDEFCEGIMPKYFKQTKWSSFARQLNLYGFMRVASGPDTGAYYHELFLKSRPSLCLHIRRVGVPQGTDRRKCRPKNVAEMQEPDFYSMKPAC
jgi:hypothetical protein